jgi:uncharacterized protein (TIGR02646 family)
VRPPELSQAGKKGFEYADRQLKGIEPRDKFPPYWRSSDVRGVLKAMCGEACAYCTDRIGRTGEDVEHYRPKNVYWFLAYRTDNYLSSCRRCNSSRKINRFPIENGHQPATAVAALKSERRLLLDPVADDVEVVLRVELTSRTYSWEVVPTAPARLRLRAEHTITFFRLNIDTELRRNRIQAIQDFIKLALSADGDMVQRARKMASRYAPHGAAVRSVALQMNPALAPSPDEELQWHITALAAEIEMAANYPSEEKDLIDTRGFALAAIHLHPPPAIPKATVREWFDRVSISGISLTAHVDTKIKVLR